MELNLPVLSQLSVCQNLLIAGMGGGFDVFCGLPIYFELTKRGQKVHLANFSFSDIASLRGGVRLSGDLVGVVAEQTDLAPYFPEKYLSQWFKKKQQSDVTVWSFQKSGVRPLLKNYRLLADYLSIDGILLIDGGVDSLMRGDESGMGTVIEDATSLCVVNELTNIRTRILATVALGAEQDVAYNQVFENIASLTQAGAFLGACALTPQMESYQAFEDAVLYVQDSPWQDASVINSSLISAVRGHFGDYHLTAKTKGSRLWISPLMALYWFFDLPVVARHNLFLLRLKETDTFIDGLHQLMAFSSGIAKRKSPSISL
ncbi:MAG: DUF1152 domain-containing protein [Chloroflexota bacterium]